MWNRTIWIRLIGGPTVSLYVPSNSWKPELIMTDVCDFELPCEHLINLLMTIDILTLSNLLNFSFWFDYNWYQKVPMYVYLVIPGNPYENSIFPGIFWIFEWFFSSTTLGVKVRNMKMDFNTGGTWHRVGQWTLMIKFYDFFSIWLSCYQAINNNL